MSLFHDPGCDNVETALRAAMNAQRMVRLTVAGMVSLNEGNQSKVMDVDLKLIDEVSWLGHEWTANALSLVTRDDSGTTPPPSTDDAPADVIPFRRRGEAGRA